MGRRACVVPSHRYFPTPIASHSCVLADTPVLFQSKLHAQPPKVALEQILRYLSFRYLLKIF